MTVEEESEMLFEAHVTVTGGPDAGDGREHRGSLHSSPACIQAREVELLGHRASPWLQGTVTQHPQQWPRGGVAGTNLGLSWDLYDAHVASPHHRIH